jgi:IPT/TIG domain
MKFSIRTAIIFPALILTLLEIGCGYGSNYNSTPSPMSAVPNISGLAPNSATAGGAGFVLTVNGSNFGGDAVVYWNSTVRATTYISGSQIMANIASADVATAGVAMVYVHSGGQNSNMMNFTIN